jgi:uncharacterized C2H2 Zn-finger protein
MPVRSPPIEETNVDEVLQCPHCDLKFGSRADLNQHIAFDHPSRDQPQDES